MLNIHFSIAFKFVVFESEACHKHVLGSFRFLQHGQYFLLPVLYTQSIKTKYWYQYKKNQVGSVESKHSFLKKLVF